MLDIIYLILGTPITIAVMYGSHVARKSMRANKRTEEAKPYQFERDNFVPGFNEAIQHQRTELTRMYRGEALRS
jgi:hypothetical protein